MNQFCIVLWGLLVMGSQANAIPIAGSFTGVIVEQVDFRDPSAPATVDLVGLPYSATFSLDPDLVSQVIPFEDGATLFGSSFSLELQFQLRGETITYVDSRQASRISLFDDGTRQSLIISTASPGPFSPPATHLEFSSLNRSLFSNLDFNTLNASTIDFQHSFGRFLGLPAPLNEPLLGGFLRFDSFNIGAQNNTQIAEPGAFSLLLLGIGLLAVRRHWS